MKHFLDASAALTATAILLGGCSASTDGADSVGNETAAIDVAAKHCEVFADRVQAIGGDHGTARLHFWIKTPNDKLDSPVAEVGFFGLQTHGNGACYLDDCKLRDTWASYPASSFFGAKDYWEIDFYLANDFMAERTFQGSFYVRTEKGTTYWANASDGKNFYLDMNMFFNVEKIAPYAYTAFQSAAVVPADRFPYLNPSACR